MLETIVDGLAILLAPLIALEVSRRLEVRREKRRRQLDLFGTLMTTRNARLSPAHVNALNAIDVVFAGRRSEHVRKAWAEYLKILSDKTLDPTGEVWNKEVLDRFVSLLFCMSAYLGCGLNENDIRDGSYLPTAWE